MIKLIYLGGNSIILFKCQWFDNKHGMKVDPRYELIEIKHGSKVYVNEPFVLAQQVVQVYYTPFLSREREKGKNSGPYTKLSLRLFITCSKKKKSPVDLWIDFDDNKSI